MQAYSIKRGASMEKPKDKSKAKGGFARARLLSKEEKSSIASAAAKARWAAKRAEVSAANDGMPEALRTGYLEIGDVKIECYVLKNGTRLIHKRGMAKAIGLQSEGGNAFLKTVNRKRLGSALPEKLREKINNPIVFKPLSGDPAHGYEATVLVELCDAIWEAGKSGKLATSQLFLAMQAEIIIRSSAKIGIIALIDEATGYIFDKRRQEYKELFRDFISNEFREWNQEFPDQFFDIFYRLYKIPRGEKGRHPQFFGKLIRKYIYTPLANSNGAILESLDEKNPVVYKNGGRKYKMFQFLSDEVGLPALKAHLWQIIGIGNGSKSKESFDRSFRNAFPEPGDQTHLDF